MTAQQAIKVGIIGTGAIGGFYGVMLAKAGYEVHYLLRSEYPAVKQNGLMIQSDVYGEIHQAQANAWNDASQMPKCDWLLVGAKTTSNPSLVPLIEAAAADNAKVVLMQNGFGVEDELRPLLSDKLHLLGGLCFICVHRGAPGIIYHQAYGGVNLGYHSGPATAEQALAITEEGASLFRNAGLDSKAMANIEQARWQKLVWNIPYNGLSVLLDATTGEMMNNPDARALIADLMQETIDAATACGHQLPDNFVQTMLKATDKMPDYHPSMYHDFTHQRPLELKGIYAAPLAAAKAAGCSMPKVEMLLQSLAFKVNQPIAEL